MSSLATVVGVSKNNVADYLIYMERAGLVGQLRDATGGIRGIGKVDKVYIDNPSLMTVFTMEPKGKYRIGKVYAIRPFIDQLLT